MAKTIFHQTSFSSGELSPSIFGRDDREVYFNGAARLRNVHISPLGGVKRRPGTKYIASTTTNQAAEMIPFEFNSEQTYLFVFTPGELKVYRDDVLKATVSGSPISSLTATQIAEMNYVQSLDTVILLHEDFQPIKILRVNDTTFTPSTLAVSNIPTFDFGDIATPGTVTPSATSGSVTLTASTSVFTSGMIGYTVRLNDGYARITAYSSGTSVTATVVDEFSGTGADADYIIEELAWSSTRGWPSCGTFFQQRLWLASTTGRPNTLWGSKISGFFDFDLGTGLDDEGIEFTLGSDQVNKIRQVFGARTLQVFTASAEWFSPINLDRTITPGTFKIERSTQHGSANVKPISADGATIYIDSSGVVIREYIFLDVEQSYISDDISYLSEHLISNPSAIARQKAQSGLATEYTYFVNDDGTIAVLNRRRAQSFLAWCLWETDGEYEDIASVGNEIYVIVKRTVDGNTVRYIEKFSYDYYTDSGIILTDSPATDTWTGLTHLEGENVSVRSGDGYPLLSNTVSSGGITTETEQTEIEVGLAWSPLIRTMPPSDQRGVIIGERKRLVSANFNLKDCNGFTVKTKSGEEIRVSLLGFGSVVLNQAPPKYTGWYRVPLRGHYRDPYIEITQTNPVDFEVLSMTMEVTV